MALDVETGTFDADATDVDDATQNVSVGFDPKALIIWGSKLATTNADTKATALFSRGFVDDADNNGCQSSQNLDGSSAVSVRRKSSSSLAVQFYSSTSQIIEKAATIALGTAQFTLTWSTNDLNAPKMHWIAFGGADITGTRTSTFVKSVTTPNVVQSVNVTDSDVKNITAGEGVLFMIASNTINDNNVNDSANPFGMATKTDEMGSNDYTNDKNAGQSEARQGFQDVKILEVWNSTSGTLLFTGEFDGFDADGFDIDWTTNNAVATVIFYLIIKGGKWQVGNDTHKITTTGTKATTTDFQPKGVIISQVGRTANGIAREDVSHNFGAAASTTTETSGGFTDDDTADPTVIGIMSSITKIARVLRSTDRVVLSEAQLDSFNSTDFTLDYTTVDSNAYKFTWCVCGDAAAGFTGTKTFTLDAVLKKEDITKTFTLDAVLEKVFTKTFTLDAVLLKVETKTFTLDAVLLKVETKTFTLDAVLEKVFTKTFTLDTVLEKVFSKTFTLDAVLQKVFTKTFTLDTVLKKLDVTKTFTLDAVLKKLDVTKTFTLDAVLTVLKTKTFTLDAVLEKVFTKTFTIDAVLKKLDVTKTFTLDAFLGGFTQTFTLDAVLKKLDITKTFTLDAVLLILETKTFTLDAVLKKLAVTKTFTLDAVLKKLTITKTFTLDAVLEKVFTKTFTLDAVLSAIATKTFTLDAVLFKVFTKTFTLDAVLGGFTKTFTLDAFLERVSVGGGSGGKVKAKGVSLVDMQEVAYKKKPHVTFGNKKLIHPHAELKMIAKFKTSVEGHIRYESRFKLKIITDNLNIPSIKSITTWKLKQFSPPITSRFKTPVEGIIQLDSKFAKRVAARIENRSKFKAKQKIKLEHHAIFDYTKIITVLESLMNLMEDEPTMEFTFNESSTLWEQDDDREKSFDAPSTVVGRVVYTPDLQTMEIELPGKTYNYCGVPERIFDAFKGASSKGAFYNREIKGIFTC